MRLLCFVGSMLCIFQLHAQDSLRITITDAEKKFIDQNLALLAEKYNISISKAAEIQAKLFNNPTLSISGNLYNPSNKKYFDVGNQTGQYALGINQLIRLAGKRNKEIALAKTTTRICENRFYDLLRTLRYSLRVDFYKSYYLLRDVYAYDKQIENLENLNQAYKELGIQGVVTQKDALRIQSLLYSLKAEKTELVNQLNELEGEMQLLLQDNKTWYIPVSDEKKSVTLITNQYTIQQLVDSAYKNRADLAISENNVLLSEQNYSLQKAMAVPDLNLGAEFDKRGSFVTNASAINLTFDLPFFNRNQGNIKAAKLSVQQNKVIASLQKQTVENEVQQAYARLINTGKAITASDPLFISNMEKLLDAITENFRKKNITLIDFTDFYESYKTNTLQVNQLQSEYAEAMETLQYTIGKNIINY